MTAPASPPAPEHSSDYRRGAALTMAMKYAAQVENSADMIADAWLVATVSAELAGCAKSRAIADALTPIVELLHASEILDPAPLSLPHLIAEFFADMGLEAPPPKALPKLQARTFAQGVATGRTLERVEVFKRNRKFRRK